MSRPLGGIVTGDDAATFGVVMSSTAKSSISWWLPCPMLNGSNYRAYITWAIRMKAYMGALGVWDWEAVEGGDEDVDACRDEMAMATIHEALSDKTRRLLAKKNASTARAMWEALETMHLGDERARASRIRKLEAEFDELRMGDGERVNDFAMRLGSAAGMIRALGGKMEEAYVMKKLLRAVPAKFLPVVCIIEQFLDLDTMTMDDMTGRLIVFEDRLTSYGKAKEEGKLLTYDEWRAKDRAARTSSDQIKRRGTHGNCGRNRKFDIARVQCYNCQNYGHFASSCGAERREEVAFVAS